MPITQELEQALGRLNQQENVLTDYIRTIAGIGRDNRPMNILTMAIVNRSLSLLHAFDVTLRSNNYLGAAHLVRLHLDSLLRYAAAWKVDDPEAYIVALMRGVLVNTLRDSEGRRLYDARLKELVARDYPWVANVYDRTSGFIHFSRTHISFSTMITDAANGVAHHHIGREDRFVREESRIEAVEAMIAISQCIGNYIMAWIETIQGEVTDRE